MSESKHTPGPWQISRLNGLIYVKNNEGFIGSLNNGECTNTWTEECEANARLVESAPALLSALKECLSDMRAMRLKDNCDPVNTFSMDEGYAAIAKATGEQS